MTIVQHSIQYTYIYGESGSKGRSYFVPVGSPVLFSPLANKIQYCKHFFEGLTIHKGGVAKRKIQAITPGTVMAQYLEKPTVSDHLSLTFSGNCQKLIFFYVRRMLIFNCFFSLQKLSRSKFPGHLKNEIWGIPLRLQHQSGLLKGSVLCVNKCYG